MRRTAFAAALLTIAALGCNIDGPVSPGSPILAKGGNGKPNNVEGTPIVWAFEDAAGDAVTSDAFGPYVHESCGVRAWFPGVHDAVLHTDWRPIQRDKNCSITGVKNRYINVTPPGLSTEEGVFLNVNDVWEVSETGLKDAVIHTPRSSYRFGFGLGGDQIQVTRTGTDSWLVETVGGHVAYSTADDDWYPLPFRATIALR